MSVPFSPFPPSPSSLLSQLDGLGRKYLLLVGILIQATGHFILFLAFSFTSAADVNIAVYVLGSSLILGGFSLGLGPITWLLQSEIFPTLIRGRAMGFSVIMRNFCEFLINFSFLSLIGLIGDHGIFLMFFILCLLALLFIRFLFVETKEKEPNEILKEFEENFMNLRRGRVGSAKGGSGYSVMCGLSDDSVSGKGAQEEDEITVRL
jgi:MFS family permease